jgi:hypothetical protein
LNKTWKNIINLDTIAFEMTYKKVYSLFFLNLFFILFTLNKLIIKLNYEFDLIYIKIGLFLIRIRINNLFNRYKMFLF